MNQYLFALRAWNQMRYQNRVFILASLSHPTVLAHRAFPFLPSWVRSDLQRRLLAVEVRHA